MIQNSVYMSRAAGLHRILPEKTLPTRLQPFLSAAMMLRYTLDLDKEADAIENAVKQVLKEGYRTIDIMPQAGESTEGIEQVGTAKMGDLIAERV